MQRTMIGSAVSPKNPSGTHRALPRNREVFGKGPMKPGNRSRMFGGKDIAGESITVVFERLRQNEGVRLNVSDESVI